MEVILDTSFIVSCIKKKIDFIAELEGMGFKVLLPKEVVEEIKDLRLNSEHATKVAVEIALELFKKGKIKGMTLGRKQVDEGLIDFGKKGAYIATLDTAIKRVIPNRIVISEQSNALEIERS
jgi:rRNA-processing protein FCF1